MEEGETSAPFWLQAPTNSRRSRFNSSILLFILCLTFSLLTLLLIPPLLSLSPQIPKPNLIKNSWESVNAIIILVALLFGFFSRIRNHESISTVGSTVSKERKSDESTATVWFENSDPKALIDDQTDRNFGFFSRTQNQESISIIRSTNSKFRNENSDPMVEIDGQTEVKKSNGSMPSVWYEDSNLTAVIDDQTGSNIINDVQKSDESTVRGWYKYSDRTTVIDDRNGRMIKSDVQESDYSNPTTVIGSRDRWRVYDDTSLAHNASLLADHADGASHIRKAPSPHLDRIKREVNTVNTGNVLSVINGIARIHVLDEVSVGEVIEFDEGIIGIVLNREFTDSVCVLIMGDSSIIREGSSIKATGKITQIPVSAGSVVNDRGTISASESRVTEDKERNKIAENQALPPVRRRRRRRARNIAKRALGITKINTGTVIGVAFGIARIHCVEEVAAGEIIEFNEGTIGIALNSEYVLLMSNGLMIQEGSCVIATGKIAQMPVSEAWLSGFLSALAKPIEDISEIFASESELNTYGQPIAESSRFVGSKENRIEQVDENPSTLGRTNEGKTSEDTDDELESLANESTIPKEEKEEEDTDDELESKQYESSSSPIISPTHSTKVEKKRGGNVTRDILTSLGMKKKKQRQKSVESIDSLFECQPPSPPPPSAAIQSFFSLKKGKGKRVISVPPPPLPPRPHFTTAHKQKSGVVEAPDIMRKPPVPVKVRSFVEVAASTNGANSPVTGAESPLHPIPPPPPPPPFQMPGWKFVVKGDYVKIASANTSRSVSPERDDVDTPRNSDFGGDLAVGSSMFCPSPDVNSKAEMFIANFRAGLKLQKMNSMKQKQGVGLSNLGPVEPNQAKA